MVRKRLIRITPEGFYYFIVMSFVFTGAVMREINLMLLLAGMMLGPLLYNARTVLRMTRHLSVVRRLPQYATAGDPLTVELTLNSKWRFSGIRAIDWIQRAGEPAPPAIKAVAPLAEAPARGSATVCYRLLPVERGEYRFGPVQLRTSFPFGLVRRTVEHELPASLVVFPRKGTLMRRWTALSHQAHETVSERRPSRSSGDFYGLRDYRNGDGRRHIHWRTSARRGKLTVRQFERPVHHDTAIYLDLWQPDRPNDVDRQAVETAVSFAATLVAELCRRQGCRIWLVAADSPGRPFEGLASPWLEHEAMKRLSLARASTRPFDEAAWIEAAEQIPRHALGVLVTSRAASPTFDATPIEQAETQAAGRTVCVSSRSSELAEFFELSEHPADRQPADRPLKR
jgi:uncharacterized protein (DUF58 family)